jgi:hypothetical protein
MVFIVNDFVSRRIDPSRRGAPRSPAQRYCQATIPLHWREIVPIGAAAANVPSAFGKVCQQGRARSGAFAKLRPQKRLLEASSVGVSIGGATVERASGTLLADPLPGERTWGEKMRLARAGER